MKVKIESEQHGRGRVFIGNQEAKDVQSVWLSIGEGQLTTVEVTYLMRAVEFEGEAEVIAVIGGRRYRLIED